MKYVLDTSVVIEKVISKQVNSGQLDGEIMVPRAVLAELENQANSGQEIGTLGLEELQELQSLAKQEKIILTFIGDRPKIDQIKMAKLGGAVDSLIMELAYNEGATLITADKVQAESAKAYGAKVMFLELKKWEKKLEIEKFFDAVTMSLHLKEDCYPMAKKGRPGSWNLEKVGKSPLNSKKVQDIAKEIVEKSRIDPKAFIEISRPGSTIVQYHEYRIVITKPPISDGWEITAIRPIKKLNLEDYQLPEKIHERIMKMARGILISGETGSGKSTIASAIAEYYANSGKITKTVESPRDLQLSDNITQYSKNFTSSEEIHDILFLSRPDNIIFDEIRDTPDFKLFTDLRLAGSNVLGVLHAAAPIDAIQRFIGRLETGMIPSVIDTILFIEAGTVHTVFVLNMTIKVPYGMTEADLARPVIEVRDFSTGKLVYEIYSYGEETVVIPVKSQETNPVRILAAMQIESAFRRLVNNVKAELVSDHKAIVYIPADDIAKVIGRQGSTIDGLEQKLGISIEVEELKKDIKPKTLGFNVDIKQNMLLFYVDTINHEVDFYINSQFLFTARSGKNGNIKIHTKSKVGKVLLEALENKQNISLKVGGN